VSRRPAPFARTFSLAILNLHASCRSGALLCPILDLQEAWQLRRVAAMKSLESPQVIESRTYGGAKNARSAAVRLGSQLVSATVENQAKTTGEN
jgi:hypothetical protein